MIQKHPTLLASQLEAFNLETSDPDTPCIWYIYLHWGGLGWVNVGIYIYMAYMECLGEERPFILTGPVFEHDAGAQSCCCSLGVHQCQCPWCTLPKGATTRWIRMDTGTAEPSGTEPLKPPGTSLSQLRLLGNCLVPWKAAACFLEKLLEPQNSLVQRLGAEAS